MGKENKTEHELIFDRWRSEDKVLWSKESNDENQFHISIDSINDNPSEFVKIWSNSYQYPLGEKYNNNIELVLENKNSFIELFKWKNGTGDVISKPKMKVVENFYSKIDVLRTLKESFEWKYFEEEFKPYGIDE